MSTPSAPVIRPRPKATDGALEFWWGPPTSDGGSAITTYTIEIPSVYVDTVGAGVGYYKISGLTNGVEYTAQIYATNGNGNGQLAYFRTVQPGLPPGVLQTQSFTRNGAGSATFNWTAPASDGGATIGWNVISLYPLDSAAPPTFRNVLGDATSITVPDLSGATTYTALLRARNDPGFSPKGVYLAPVTFGSIPSDISGLRIWLDAADVSTLFSDAGGVVQSSIETSQIQVWKDKSGYNRVFNGSVVRHLLTGINGNRYPCIQFSSGASLTSTGSFSISDTNSATVVLVAQMVNLSSNNQYFITGSSNGIQMSLDLSRAANFVFNADGGSEFSAISGAFISITAASTSTVTTKIFNPSPLTVSSSRANIESLNTSSLFSLGANSADIRISELLIWDRALSSIEQTTIANYLQNKWGFSLTMPAPIVYLVAADVTGGDTTWTDRSGNGWDATLADGTSAKNGSNALVLDGSTYWTFGDIGEKSNFSISVWFKRTAAIGSGGCIVTEAYSGGTALNMAIYGGTYGASDTQFVGGFFDSGGWEIGAPQEFALNTWVQMSVTWDGTNIKTYINGSLVNTTNQSGKFAVSTGLGYRIGRRWDNADYVTGDLGEIRIDDVPLTSAQISKYYNDTSGNYP